MKIPSMIGNLEVNMGKKKFDMIEIINGRLEEIDKQLNVAVRRMQWAKVEYLRKEEVELKTKLKELEAKRSEKESGKLKG
jgi:hypothetical protein